MILRVLPFLLLLLFAHPVAAQEKWTAVSIADEMKENANAVIRLDRTDITINSRKSMTVKKYRVVTIFGEQGLHYMDASEVFSNTTTIKSIEAVIYDAYGKEIKKIKRKDFRESAISQGSIITDDKLLALSYTPVQYPFTIVYESEVQSSTTAFLPRWSPVEGLYSSVERSEFNITHNGELGFKYKEYNFGTTPFEKNETGTTLSLTALNIPALKSEDYSPSQHKMRPQFMFGLEKFNLEGVDGEAKDWKTFGSWMYDNLLTGTDELPAATIAAIQAKVAGETDVVKKARIVYDHVQSKTRYISIQLGIGGWKPMLAKDVDRLGYGDCKALTNYTRALLKAVGIESYYTVVYAGSDKNNVKEDFVSMQGNHAILAIPHNNDYIWLECTSQIAPFGFQGPFTDDRMVLLITPEGGKVVKTHVYKPRENTQESKGSYSISETGALAGSLTVRSKGTQYDNKYDREHSSREELDKMYKDDFSNINNLKLKKTNLLNNKDSQEFTEEINLEAEGYCNKNGNRIMFAVNAFNQLSHVPQRYRARKNPFEVSRGFYDTDEVVIDLPQGFTIEAKPDNVTLTDKFGEYKAEYEMIGTTKMLYKRTLQMNDGYYDSGEYENYRLFREKIARNDNAKVVLVKN